MTTPSLPAVGSPAPTFTALDQHGNERSLDDFAGRPVLLYFYPKAMTPGCTTQSCLMRDVAGDIGDAVIIGVSPDTPERQKKFDDKHELGFTLLSDPDHEIAEAYGIWAEKKLYGKVYMGVVRSAFLIGPDGTLAAVFGKISPKDTPIKLLAALEALA
ncbi:MAG: thioredoxin-dependent thiol peroxidase [Acidimicrobiales bacterium]